MYVCVCVSVCKYCGGGQESSEDVDARLEWRSSQAYPHYHKNVSTRKKKRRKPHTEYLLHKPGDVFFFFFSHTGLTED